VPSAACAAAESNQRDRSVQTARRAHPVCISRQVLSALPVSWRLSAVCKQRDDVNGEPRDDDFPRNLPIITSADVEVVTSRLFFPICLTVGLSLLKKLVQDKKNNN